MQQSRNRIRRGLALILALLALVGSLTACGAQQGWRGKEIVNLSRAFLDTNGAHQETNVSVDMPDEKENYFHKIATPAVAQALRDNDVKGAWTALLNDLNVCSQQGLVEMFDASIGAGSVYMP